MAEQTGSEHDEELNRLAISENTRRNYDKGLEAFMRWAEENSREFNGPLETDRALNDFAHFLWRENRGRGGMRKAMDARCAVLHYLPDMAAPSGGMALPLSLQAIQGWDRTTVPKRKSPVPILVARAIAARLLGKGFFRYAAAVLIAFDCLLRPDDVINLTATRCHKWPVGWVLSMEKTDKTRTTAKILCDDPFAVAALEGWMASATGESRLLSTSYTAFYKAFVGAAKDLNLGDIKFSPHCLRHGGAVQRVFIRGHSRQVVKDFGRWKTDKAFNGYLDVTKAE